MCRSKRPSKPPTVEAEAKTPTLTSNGKVSRTSPTSSPSLSALSSSASAAKFSTLWYVLTEPQDVSENTTPSGAPASSGLIQFKRLVQISPPSSLLLAAKQSVLDGRISDTSSSSFLDQTHVSLAGLAPEITFTLFVVKDSPTESRLSRPRGQSSGAPLPPKRTVSAASPTRKPERWSQTRVEAIETKRVTREKSVKETDSQSELITLLQNRVFLSFSRDPIRAVSKRMSSLPLSSTDYPLYSSVEKDKTYQEFTAAKSVSVVATTSVSLSNVVNAKSAITLPLEIEGEEAPIHPERAAGERVPKPSLILQAVEVNRFTNWEVP